MEQLGFGARWRAWVCGILATSTTRVMVNGDPGSKIYNCEGLRQGDPVSPMLFTLTMEPLQRLFDWAVDRGLLHPQATNGMRKRISIFADDVVLFVKPEPMDLVVCKCIFDLFGEASGLQINMSKSVALPIRCSDQSITMASAELGCLVGSFPVRYL